MRNWAYQWKISFNPDPSKQIQEVIFSHKIEKANHPVLFFNNIQVNQTPYQKQRGMFLDDKLNFEKHLKYITNKVNKSIRLLRKLHMILPIRSLVTIYKSFIRPHLDCRDKSFHGNLESIQCSTSLTITGAIRGTSRANLYQELVLPCLQERSWFHKLCTFFFCDNIYKWEQLQVKS